MRNTGKLYYTLVALIFLLLPVYIEAKDNVKIRINNGNIQNCIEAYVEKDIMMMPLRTVSEAIGAKVNFVQDTQQILITKENIEVQLEIGSNIGIINNQTIKLPLNIEEKDNTAIVPIRFLSEALNFNVKYHNNAEMICINTKENVDNCIAELDMINAYMLAIDTIYQEDSALNHNIKYLAIDNSQTNYLSYDARRELIKRLDKYNLEVLEKNFDELVELELIREGGFKEGVLISIDDSDSIEDKLVIRIEKYRSSLGAISCPKMTIEKIDGAWKITSQDKWLMS